MRLPLLLAVLAVAAALSAGCNGSRDKILASLQSPRPEERALAVKKLADIGRSEDLTLISRAAKDPSAMVRSEAAEALGQSQDPRMIDLLGELLQDQDESVQAKAAIALAHFNSDKSKAYLVAQYSRRGHTTRVAIVQALKTANVPGAMAAAVAAEANVIWERNLRALTDGALPERVAAAEELGKSGRAEAFERLLPLTRDSQVILASAAVRGLGFAGDRRAVPAVASLLNENFPELRESALETLLRLQDPQALPQLQKVAIEKSAASSLATAAIIALPRLPQTDQALCEVAYEGAYADALAAGREMRTRGGCPKEPLLERLGRSSTIASALQALHGLGPTAKEVAPKVLPLLAHSDEQVRQQAVNALVELGEPAAVPGIQKIYEDELKALEGWRQKWITAELPKQYAPGFDPADPENYFRLDGHIEDLPERQRRRADLFEKIKALDQARAKSLGRTLIEPRVPTEVADDASEDRLALLGAAIRALGVLEAPGAVKLLSRHIDDASPSLRSAAFVGLAALGPEGIAIAKQGLVDPDRDVQGAVANALAAEGEAGQLAIIELLPKLRDRMRLLEAIARVVPAPQASAPLQVILAEGGPESALAAYALGELRAKDAVPALLKSLADRAGLARRDVLQALGKIGDPSAAEAVARELYHDSPEVRGAAAEALAQLGTAGQLEALDALKSDYYRRVRESAEQALSRVGATSEAQR